MTAVTLATASISTVGDFRSSPCSPSSHLSALVGLGPTSEAMEERFNSKYLRLRHQDLPKALLV